MRGNGMSGEELERIRVRKLEGRSVGRYAEGHMNPEAVCRMGNFLKKIRDNERRYAEILACINNEWEMIAYAYCMSPSPKNIGEIFGRFKEITSTGRLFESSRTSTFASYLDRKFVKYGFAEAHQVEGKRCWSHGGGREEILPIIAFALGFSLKKGKSINAALGDYSGHSHYGPYNRAKLLIKLLDDGACSKKDLIDDTKAWINLDHHIYPLRDEGFIDFESSETKEYWFNKQSLRELKLLPEGKMRRKISEFVRSHGRVRVSEVQRGVGCNLCYVSTILTGLALDEILKCDFASVEKSKASLLPEGRDAAEMLKRVRAAAHGKTLCARLPDISQMRGAAMLYLPYTRGSKRARARARRAELEKI